MRNITPEQRGEEMIAKIRADFTAADLERIGSFAGLHDHCDANMYYLSKDEEGTYDAGSLRHAQALNKAADYVNLKLFGIRPKRYKVQMKTISGWEDAPWTIDDLPMRFNTVLEAESEINSVCEPDPMSSYIPHERDEFRVVPAEEE